MIDGKNSVLIRPETVISDVCSKTNCTVFFLGKNQLNFTEIFTLKDLHID